MSMEFWLGFFAGPVTCWFIVLMSELLATILGPTSTEPHRPNCEICGAKKADGTLVSDGGRVELCMGCLQDELSADEGAEL